MATYIAKLGPGNLGTGFSFLDREIADSLPSYCALLRLRDAVSLAVEACRRVLHAVPDAPLHLVDVAGGAGALCLAVPIGRISDAPCSAPPAASPPAP